MLINEVEHIVGLSKKSIRFYEENGLLTPVRNQENSYRIYDLEDIKKLKKIKILRELGVPMCDLKKLNEKSLSLEECMMDRIKKIEKEEENYLKVKKMCQMMMNTGDTYEKIDMTSYFEEMNQLGKEGFTLRNVKTSKTKKIVGAILSSLIFSSFFLLLVGVISYFQFMESNKIPWIIYLGLMFLLLLPILGMGKNLVSRILEINKGEEDEASKY